MLKRKRGYFRGNCAAAKMRLGSGFWDSARGVRNDSIERAKESGASGEEVLNRFINQFKSSVQRQHENNEEDEQFYRRIKAFLKNAPNSNPLACVLDRGYMQMISSTERERYVFNLSAKVQNCVRRYNMEKELEINMA